MILAFLVRKVLVTFTTITEIPFSASAALWLTATTIAVFFLSLLVVALVVVYLPADYFRQHGSSPKKSKSAILRVFWRIIKNILGVIVFLGGVIMLFTPGQGVLTILIGLLLIDFPGKHSMISRLVRRPSVRNSLNQFRKRFSKPPFEFGENSQEKETNEHCES